MQPLASSLAERNLGFAAGHHRTALWHEELCPLPRAVQLGGRLAVPVPNK